ncbi:MAG: hypothetical protein QXQ18_01860 [Candidatus Aenigmatarchaeota archaeon]
MFEENLEKYKKFYNWLEERRYKIKEFGSAEKIFLEKDWAIKATIIKWRWTNIIKTYDVNKVLIGYNLIFNIISERYLLNRFLEVTPETFDIYPHPEFFDVMYFVEEKQKPKEEIIMALIR